MTASARRTASLLAQVEHFFSLSQKPKPLQILYSTQPNWPHSKTSSSCHQIDIGILDSSFNPPHQAHFALAKSSKPRFSKEDEKSKESYDSLLLIFSIQNADKGRGTKKDASIIDRLEMMQEFAKDIEEETKLNVAVAIVEEPLMISKSTLIHQYIEQQEFSSSSSTSIPSIRLHWLVGFDTLQRFFQVKYYPSPTFFHEACDNFFLKERTTFVCARRGMDSLPNKQSEETKDEEEERELLQSKEVKPWVDQGFIVMIDLEKNIRSVSSTAIRKQLLKQSEGGIMPDKLQQMTTKRVAKYLLQASVYRNEGD